MSEELIPYRGRVRIDLSQGGRTKQSHSKSCDINLILAKYLNTGEYGHVTEGVAHYGDFSDVMSYRDAVTRVNLAEQQFSELPAQTRARVNNDPQEFLAFVADPENREECEQLGLFEKPEESIVPTAPEVPAKTEETAPAVLVPQGGE